MQITLPDGRKVLVDYDYKEGSNDRFSRGGWIQGDPPEVRVTSAVTLNGTRVRLSEKELDYIELYIHEHRIER